LHSSTSINDQPNGTANLVRELCEGFRGFKREDLIHGHTPAIQPLKHGKLAGAETKDLSMNVWNGRRFLIFVGSSRCE
jgi:hypothetical protein